jgi:CheY-like chemotaxis protein
VSTADDGAQALQRLEQEAFDLVISDLEMPFLDGWELARRARRLPGGERLPLIALSTLADDAARQRAMAAGFDAYEVKFDPGTLRLSIDTLLAERRLLQTVGDAAE